MRRREVIALIGCVTAAAALVERLATDVLAQTSASPAAGRSLPSYAEARQAFESLPADSRMRLEALLIAAGYVSSASGRFSGRLLNAIQDLQRSNGLVPDGILSEPAMERLRAEATPLLKTWGMQQRFHIFTMRKLWIPVGVLQIAQPIGTGMRYTDPFGRLRMEHSFIEDADLAVSYRQALEMARTEGGTIRFRIIRPNFCSVAWTSADGRGAYARLHRAGPGLYGFSLFWDKTAADLKPDRMAKLVSMSLTWDLRRGALIEPSKLIPAAAAAVVTVPATGLRP
jgi:hypothetical protein